MDNSILISVIIPAYNAEKYLDRAVQSVLCQMDGSIELILVDDGSTDGTGAVCDGYAESHPNVRVVHKANGGLSYARNAGIRVAIGEYLLFLDADDYFEPDACREVSKVILAHRPDMIDFGWRYISNGVAMSPAFHKLPKNVLLGERELKELILPPLLNLRNDPDCFVFDFSCMKAFQKEIVKNNGICFDENRRIWEDRPFVVQYLRYCKNYYAMDRCFYNYVDVPGSLSRKFSIEFFRIIVENYQLYKSLFGEEYNFDTEYVNEYWCRAIENMIFRSLDQEDERNVIRGVVLATLQNEQVKHWYEKRKPANRFEEKVSGFVIDGHAEAAYDRYVRQKQKSNVQKQFQNIVKTAKTAMKRVLKRG